MDHLILLDFETTKLLEPEAADLSRQVEAIEVGAMKLDWETLEEVGRVDQLIQPSILPLDKKITEITGITDDDLEGKPSFAAVFPDLVELFMGVRYLMCHNLPFDRGVLFHELRRLNRELRFPWPPEHLCSAELSEDITGKYMKQEDLYEHVTGEPANQTHRAIEDVEQLLVIARWMREDERI